MPKAYDYDVTGLNQVLTNLNEAVDDIDNKTKEGIYEAGLKVERESKKRTPVDTGHLKGSTYTEPIQLKANHVVEIGYLAHYAPHVHEQVENYHEVGQAKFLEDAIKDNEREIVEIIRNRAGVD